MTRRDFLPMSLVVPVVPVNAGAPLIVPVNLVIDGRAKLRPAQVGHFWSTLWPEAVSDFEGGGIRLESRLRAGDIWRPAYRQPVISGLGAGAINLVITDRVPGVWEQGRGLSGVTTRYRGYHLCMVALNYAHGHQVPFILVNTCVHELLHALLHDIFEPRPAGVAGEAREFRIDWYATGLWLFHDGAGIRKYTLAYLQRLRSEPAPPSARESGVRSSP